MNRFLNTENTDNTNSGAKRGTRRGVKNHAKSSAKRNENSVNHNNTSYAEHYTTMDLCSQAQMSENADNILSRMNKLRAFASEQQAKRAKSQRQQTSFCF
ncbi:MAG: hypothetical protein ACI936_001241 [Paraglaciecola sp.]|jgi:hypothetical protein